MSCFISCDWGTSNFRLRIIDRENESVIAECHSDQGIATVFSQWRNAVTTTLSPDTSDARIAFYQAILLDQIRQLSLQSGIEFSGKPVIVSGMASSAIGLSELPYKELPVDADGQDFPVKRWPASARFPCEMILISGVRTTDDIMRGEETQLIGCSLVKGLSNCLYILPGTHSKHVVLENGRICHFSTFMTGEFFHLLSQKSLLAGSVTASAGDTGHDQDSFAAGVSESRRSSLLHNSFLVRTRHLLGRLSKEANYQFLSGLLIGEELKEMAGSTTPVVLVGSESQLTIYEQACFLLQIPVLAKINADQALVKGHIRLYDLHC